MHFTFVWSRFCLLSRLRLLFYTFCCVISSLGDFDRSHRFPIRAFVTTTGCSPTLPPLFRSHVAFHVTSPSLTPPRGALPRFVHVVVVPTFHLLRWYWRAVVVRYYYTRCVTVRCLSPISVTHSPIYYIPHVAIAYLRFTFVLISTLLLFGLIRCRVCPTVTPFVVHVDTPPFYVVRCSTFPTPFLHHVSVCYGRSVHSTGGDSLPLSLIRNIFR